MREVLIVGSGAREHALVWKVKQSSSVGQIYCAPGNPGVAELADCIPIQANEIEKLANFAQKKRVDLTIVGPEDPLKEGIVNAFEKRDLVIFGPSQSAAQIETSKVFAKELMKGHAIPTADFRVFHVSEIKIAHEYVEKHGAPIVVKPDGLAEGKGAVVAEDTEAAKEAINNILVKKVFPEAGNAVIIENFLEGDEISITAIANERTFVPFLLSQDHKRAYDGDKGPNTGGMGVYAPLSWVTPKFESELLQVITQPTLDALEEEGLHFKGVLYSNVMVTPKGPMVLEHNARFGDPEAQALFPLLENDLVEVVCCTLDGKLKDVTLKWSGKFAVCLTLAAPGYPKMPVEDVKAAYMMAYDLGCLGITVYRDGSKFFQVLNTALKREMTKVHEGPVEPRGDETLDSKTARQRTPDGHLYATVGEKNGEPFEAFATLGKAGQDISAWVEAISRMISTGLQFTPKASRIERLEAFARQLIGIGGSRSIGFGSEKVLSGPDGLGQALLEIIEIYKGHMKKTNGYKKIEINSHDLNENSPELNVQSLEQAAGNFCSACGNNTMVFEEGCSKCHSCGNSEC